MKLSLFDLHADTAWAMYEHRQPLGANTLAVSLDKATAFARYVQVMALWTHPTLSDEDGWERCAQMLQNLENDPAVRESRARLCTACPTDPSLPSLLLSVEDARILNGKAERVDALYDMGVRILTPLWKGESCIGGAHDTDTGLTDFGKSALTRALEHGMVLDISHASERAADDIFNLAARDGAPVIASHSNAYTLCGVSRNLRDGQIKEILDTGGVIGINLYTHFLRENGNACISDVIRHITYFLEMGAVDALCLGCDMDGADLPADIPDLSYLPRLAEELQKRNYSDETIRAIFFENAYRFAEQHIR
ncbi:MAG: membrane dipeptidase [Clostridia bacterium]|nr:membrane dipeptidase [Clostridia bacterium]